MTKVSKTTAHYQDRPRGESQCSECTMFRPPHGCTAVDGNISPTGWCKYFYRKTAKADGGTVDMPLIKSGSKQAIGENIKAEKAAGKPQDQAVAIALNTARRYKKRAVGGGVKASTGYPTNDDFDSAEGLLGADSAWARALPRIRDALPNESGLPDSPWLPVAPDQNATIRSYDPSASSPDLPAYPVWPWLYDSPRSFAGGGWLGEFDTPDAPPERPRNPAEDYLDTVARIRSLQEANPPRPGDFMPARGLYDVGKIAAEMTGVPSVVRGARDIRDEKGDAWTKAKGAAEIATGAIPALSATRRGAKMLDAIYGTIPRAGATTAALSLPDAVVSARADSARGQDKLADIKPPQFMLDELRVLQDQKAAKQTEFNILNQKHARSGPETQRQALEPLRQDLTSLNSKITEAENRIRDFMAQATEKARQELPFRERYPGAAQTIMGAAAVGTTALPFANAVKHNLADWFKARAMNRAARTAEQAFVDNNPVKFTEMQRSLARRAEDLDRAGSFTQSHAWPIVKGTGLGALSLYEASAIPEQVDALAFPPGHPTREAARDEFGKWDYYKSRILPSLTGALATTGLGHELGTLITPKARVPEAARNIINRGSTQSIDDLKTFERYQRAVQDAKNAGQTERDARQLEGAAILPVQPALPKTDDLPSLSAPQPGSVQRALESPQRQQPPVATVSNPQAPLAEPPATKSIPDGWTYKPEGKGAKYHDENNRWAALPKAEGASAPAKESSEGASKAQGKQKDKKVRKSKSDDDAESRRHGGGVDRGALATARKYANGGGVHAGPVMGTTGGRADAKPVSVESGAYIIPADVVAAVGGSNTPAGMAAFDRLFGRDAYASGGAPPVPIKISDGEYAVSPKAVAKMGNGDPELGKRALEKLILKIRKQHIQDLKALPAPARE